MGSAIASHGAQFDVCLRERKARLAARNDRPKSNKKQTPFAFLVLLPDIELATIRPND